MATFMHSRRFLSYHEDRFTDCSLLIFATTTTTTPPHLKN